MEKLIAKCKAASTNLLKDSAKGLAENFTEGAGVAFVAVLNELENRMTEKEYVIFCDAL